MAIIIIINHNNYTLQKKQSAVRPSNEVGGGALESVIREGFLEQVAFEHRLAEHVKEPCM